MRLTARSYGHRLGAVARQARWNAVVALVGALALMLQLLALPLHPPIASRIGVRAAAELKTAFGLGFKICGAPEERDSNPPPANACDDKGSLCRHVSLAAFIAPPPPELLPPAARDVALAVPASAAPPRSVSVLSGQPRGPPTAPSET